MMTRNIKKSLLLTIAFACLLTLCACGDDDRVITPDQLPTAAQTYIEKNYPESSILIAKKETELLKTTYEVTLDNGMKLEFDSAGNLSDVDFED